MIETLDTILTTFKQTKSNYQKFLLQSQDADTRSLRDIDLENLKYLGQLRRTKYAVERYVRTNYKMITTAQAKNAIIYQEELDLSQEVKIILELLSKEG